MTTAEYVAQVVASWPTPTDDQLESAARILAGVVAEDVAA